MIARGQMYDLATRSNLAKIARLHDNVKRIDVI